MAEVLMFPSVRLREFVEEEEEELVKALGGFEFEGVSTQPECDDPIVDV